MSHEQDKELPEARGMSPTEPARRPARRLNTASLYADNRLQPPVTLLHRIADILHFNCTKMSKNTGQLALEYPMQRYNITNRRCQLMVVPGS